jgi:hypothetical protein
MADLSDADDVDTMSFKSTRGLCDTLKYILSMPDMCDVTFLVGENNVPIHGVRAILASRSRYVFMFAIIPLRFTVI